MKYKFKRNCTECLYRVRKKGEQEPSLQNILSLNLLYSGIQAFWLTDSSPADILNQPECLNSSLESMEAENIFYRIGSRFPLISQQLKSLEELRRVKPGLRLNWLKIWPGLVLLETVQGCEAFDHRCNLLLSISLVGKKFSWSLNSRTGYFGARNQL